ncbi:hypothetical protein FA13DRAFT_1733328, partial [Coprinellus micaceus]
LSVGPRCLIFENTPFPLKKALPHGRDTPPIPSPGVGFRIVWFCTTPRDEGTLFCLAPLFFLLIFDSDFPSFHKRYNAPFGLDLFTSPSPLPLCLIDRYFLTVVDRRCRVYPILLCNYLCLNLVVYNVVCPVGCG